VFSDGFICRSLHIIIEVVNGPQVAKVPIKLRVLPVRARRNGRHHYIATIARIPGHSEIPRLIFCDRWWRPVRDGCLSNRFFLAEAIAT